MPPKGKKAKSSPSKSAPKRFGSLSSFQPTLSFKPVSQASSSSSSSLPAPTPEIDVDDEDRKLMPPPPLPKRAASKTTAKGKGKGKARAVEEDSDDDVEMIEIIDIDDDEPPRKRKVAEVPQAPKQMWTDRYAPDEISELAPGKARIAKVREWLYEAVHGVPEAAGPSRQSPSQAMRDRMRKYKRVLLVTGPAGIGKTTTVRLLAQQLGLELVEWLETSDERSLGSGIDYESSISKFVSFLSRNAYPALHVNGSSHASSSKPRVLFMTSLPNLGHLPTREAFHVTLLEFCKNYNSSSCPLVIVHSDSGAGGRAEESWMDRERGGYSGGLEILGRDVRDGPWCAEIDFLPLAPTFLKKALARVLSLTDLPPSQRPSANAVQLIAQTSNGDLRSAINSLQLLCTGSSVKSAKRRKTDGEKKKASGRGSRGGKGAKLDVSEDIRAALDAVTRREQSLNLFHALGKVFYNKRLDDPQTDHDDPETLEEVRKLPKDDLLPTHLQHYTRRKSLVQIESFIPTIPIDASTFSLWIHHNIPSFCTDIDQTSAMLDDFCAADLMRTDDDIWQSSPQAIAYALHLTVRGALMALPSPVPRLSQKVVKPQFFESLRQEREHGALLDVAAGHMAKKLVDASVAFSNGTAVDEEHGAWGGIAPKCVLAAETVPMAIKIQSHTERSLLPLAVKGLALPPYSSAAYSADELETTDMMGGEADIEAEMGGEDGMGVPEGQGWAVDDGSWNSDDEVGWLADDDIVDFDDE